MALTNIEYGSIASSKVLNDNFNYLEDKIEDYSKNIASDKASLISLINSQISTTFTQLNTKITESIQALYPVGSIYIGVTDTCPIAELFGTWEKVSSGRVLQGTSGSQKAGNTVEAGLPNITGDVQWTGNGRDVGDYLTKTGCFSGSRRGGYGNGQQYPNGYVINFDASKSNPIYKDGSTVQPPAYLVNIWRRTA